MKKVKNYKPDQWLVLQIGDLYKVFGIWRGGFIGWYSWRLNSGITKIEEDEDHFLFHGHSGSIYRCHKGSYGTSFYGKRVIDGFKKQIDVLVLEEDDVVRLEV